MSATIVRNASKAMVCQEEHLRFPVVGIQWPTMREDHDWTVLWSPNLVVDLSAVLDSVIRHVVELGA